MESYKRFRATVQLVSVNSEKAALGNIANTKLAKLLQDSKEEEPVQVNVGCTLAMHCSIRQAVMQQIKIMANSDKTCFEAEFATLAGIYKKWYDSSDSNYFAVEKYEEYPRCGTVLLFDGGRLFAVAKVTAMFTKN